MASSTASAEASRICKRVIVIILALVHLMVTLYVLHLIFNASVPDCLKGMSPPPTLQVAMTELQLARRKAAIEYRRQATPLLLILRVKDIQAEVAMSKKRQVCSFLLFKPVSSCRVLSSFRDNCNRVPSSTSTSILMGLRSNGFQETRHVSWDADYELQIRSRKRE